MAVEPRSVQELLPSSPVVLSLHGSLCCSWLDDLDWQEKALRSFCIVLLNVGRRRWHQHCRAAGPPKQSHQVPSTSLSSFPSIQCPCGRAGTHQQPLVTLVIHQKAPCLPPLCVAIPHFASMPSIIHLLYLCVY